MISERTLLELQVKILLEAESVASLDLTHQVLCSMRTWQHLGLALAMQQLSMFSIQMEVSSEFSHPSETSIIT